MNHRRPTANGFTALLVVVAGVVGAFLTRTPQVVVVVAPFALALAWELATARTPPLVVVAARVPPRVVVGDRLPLTLTLRTDGPARRRLEVRADPGLVPVVDGDALEVSLPGGEQAFTVDLRAVRWGLVGIHEVAATWTGALGLLTSTTVHPLVLDPVRVLPRPEVLATVRPRRTSGWAGLQTARISARGTEFAELRPYAPGDRPRDMHWPTTQRRGEPWVMARHPERGGEVVLALDLFDPALLPWVVRTTLQLVDAYHATRDRIGIVGLGGVLTWVAPGGGERHRVAMVDQVIASQYVPTWITRSVDHLPPRTLPPGALVIAVAALGETMTNLCVQLLERGHDVVVLDLERPVAAYDVPSEEAAARILRLQQVARRRSLRALGSVVVGHDVADPIEHALAHARSQRRRVRA